MDPWPGRSLPSGGGVTSTGTVSPGAGFSRSSIPRASCDSRSGRAWRRRSTLRARAAPAPRSRRRGRPRGPQLQVEKSQLLPMQTSSQRSRAVRGYLISYEIHVICHCRRTHEERLSDRHDDEACAEMLCPCASPPQRHAGMVREINRTHDRRKSGHHYILTRRHDLRSSRDQSTKLATTRQASVRPVGHSSKDLLSF